MNATTLETKNVTKQDAYQRVVYAKMGFLAQATDDFLMHLRSYLYQWIADIDTEMVRRAQQAQREEEIRLDEERWDEEQKALDAAQAQQ